MAYNLLFASSVLLLVFLTVVPFLTQVAADSDDNSGYGLWNRCLLLVYGHFIMSLPILQMGSEALFLDCLSLSASGWSIPIRLAIDF